MVETWVVEGKKTAAARYRLVATDLDGTLLDERGSVTSEALHAVRCVQDAGVTVCLATSRRLTGTAPVAEALGLRGPLILYDGTQVRHSATRAILMELPLPAHVGQQVVDILADQGLQPIVQHGDVYSERLLVGPTPQGPSQAEHFLANFAHQIVELPVSALCEGQPEPLRIVAFGLLRALERAAAAIAQLECGVQLLERGNYGTAELSVFAPAASKGNALLWLANYLGIAAEETIAIGDGVNDVSMLRAAGLGVAMGNAWPAAKQAADVVTASNEEHGVAEALNRFVLRGVVAREGGEA